MDSTGGLKLYILNKLKDTIFNGKKNNTYYQTIFHTTRFNKNLRLYSCCLSQNQLYKKDKLFFGGLIQNQRKYYHRSNIRALKRIGPKNEDVLSIIIASILGYSLYIKKTFSPLITVTLNPHWVTGFTNHEGTIINSKINSEDRAIGW